MGWGQSLRCKLTHYRPPSYSPSRALGEGPGVGDPQPEAAGAGTSTVNP
jgi:hypothetical protein